MLKEQRNVDETGKEEQPDTINAQPEVHNTTTTTTDELHDVPTAITAQ